MSGNDRSRTLSSRERAVEPFPRPSSGRSRPVKGGGAVASETSQGALDVTSLEMRAPSANLDRVMQTAGDRPVQDSLPPLPDPTTDHGDAELTRRRQDVEEKHRR